MLFRKSERSVARLNERGLRGRSLRGLAFYNKRQRNLFYEFHLSQGCWDAWSAATVVVRHLKERCWNWSPDDGRGSAYQLLAGDKAARELAAWVLKVAGGDQPNLLWGMSTARRRSVVLITVKRWLSLLKEKWSKILLRNVCLYGQMLHPFFCGLPHHRLAQPLVRHWFAFLYYPNQWLCS